MSNLPPGFETAVKRRGNVSIPAAPSIRIAGARFTLNEAAYVAMGSPKRVVVAFNPQTRQVGFSSKVADGEDSFSVAPNGPVELARSHNVSCQRLLNDNKAPFKSTWALISNHGDWWITASGLPVSDEREKQREAERAAKRAKAASNGSAEAPAPLPAPEWGAV